MPLNVINKLMTMGEIKAVTDTKLNKDFSALTALSGTPATGDTLVIQNGSQNYKIDYDALATAIISKLGDPVTVGHGGTNATSSDAARVNLEAAADISVPTSVTTFADLHPYLNKIPQYGSATIFIRNSSLSSLLTGGAAAVALKGFVNRGSADMFDFIMTGVNSNSLSRLITWRISGYSSASATPTIGEVTYYSPQITLSSAEHDTWEKVYAVLSQMLTYRTSTIYSGPTSTSILTDGKLDTNASGIISRSVSGSYSLLLRSAGNVYIANINNASASSRSTSVYQITGTRM